MISPELSLMMSIITIANDNIILIQKKYLSIENRLNLLEFCLFAGLALEKLKRLITSISARYALTIEVKMVKTSFNDLKSLENCTLLPCNLQNLL